MRGVIAALAVGFLTLAVAGASTPSAILRPPVPFPIILADAATSEFVAPGVSFGAYDLLTADGPLSVRVITVDLKEPTVRVDSVLANDTLVSKGERLSAMAARTGAVAGINADYFDIGNTNQPLGVVIRAGQVIKTPNAQPALGITRDRRAVIEPLPFSGSADVQTIPIALTAVNGWPPERGASLMTPAFGALPPAADVTVAQLEPLDEHADIFGRYRVARVLAADQTLQPGYALAIGPTAFETLGPPQPGDIVTLSVTSSPALGSLWAAVGGGPLLIHNGVRFTDASAPAASEATSRIPVSGAIVRGNGTLALIEVDGRTQHSIGLTRAEFASLMLALGAREGLSFDGGGSSALVLRRLGDRGTALQTVPSDGIERPVADGLFIYSDAPHGPPARLVVRPAVLRALVGASVPLEFAATDFAGHAVAQPHLPLRAALSPSALGTFLTGSTFVAGMQPGNGVLHVTRGRLMADVPVHVADRAARLIITPVQAHLAPGESKRFSLSAYDRDGFPLAAAPSVRWSATGGRITQSGLFTADARDATIRAAAGDQLVQERIRVGEHEVALQFGTRWRFVSTPANNPGKIDFGVACARCITLSYDFTDAERAGSMVGELPLPEDSIGLRLDVNGDGNGEVLRIALTNSLNERVLLTLARVTWRGWQTRDLHFPATLTSPLRLHAIYVVNALHTETVHTAGAIAFRDLRLIVAGLTSGTNF